MGVSSVTDGADPVVVVPTFSDFVRPHLASMTWLAARLAPADHEDVVQDAAARAWHKYTQFDPTRGSPRSWLLAIVADQVRKRPRRPVALPMAPAPPDETPEDLIDLHRALPVLTARQRLAVDCYYFADLSVGDTAVVMGCSAGTVKSTLADARTRLRRALEDGHG